MCALNCKKRREYRDDWADWTLPTLCLLCGCLEISWGKITGLLAGSAEGLEANWSPKHISSPTDVHCSIFVDIAYRFQKELISASSLACLPRKHFNNTQFKSIHPPSKLFQIYFIRYCITSKRMLFNLKYNFNLIWFVSGHFTSVIELLKAVL